MQRTPLAGAPETDYPSPEFDQFLLAGTPATPTPPVHTHTRQRRMNHPGASAHAEYRRRKTQWVHCAPRGLRLIRRWMQSPPAEIDAWKAGVAGEKRVGAALNAARRRGTRILHDRVIPETSANIDHIAITPTGVYVIDAKNYRGTPAVSAGHLTCGGRDVTHLISRLRWQIDVVADALRAAGMAPVPVAGVLAFLSAPARPQTIGGVAVASPAWAAQLCRTRGPASREDIRQIWDRLAAALPPAKT